MKPLPLNLSSFRKVHEDKDSSVLENNAGHKIKIAHKALPRSHRTLLKNLPLYPAEAQEEQNEEKLMATGGEINPKLEQSKKIPPQDKMIGALRKKARYAEGTPDAPVSQEDNSPLQIEQVPEEKPLEVEQIPETPGRAIASDDGNQTEEEMQNPQHTREDSTNPPAISEGNTSPNLYHGYQEQLSGLKENAQAQGALGQEQSKLYGDLSNTYSQMASDAQHHLGQIQNEWNALSQEVQSGRISPDNYWNNHSKIATGLGLILAGFNPTNQPNAALNFLKSNIERDTQAQEAEMGKKSNLLSHYAQMFHDVQDATQFINGAKAQSVAAQLNAAAAKSQNPLQQAQYKQLAGQLEMNYAPQAMGLAIKQSAYNALGSGHSGANVTTALRLAGMNDIANDFESRDVPGIGMAQVKVPEAARDKLIAHQTLDTMARDMYNWASQHSGELRGLNESDINEGKTKAAALQQYYRAAINGGVFKKGEQEFIDGIVDSDPTKFFNGIRVLPKLKAVLDSNHAAFNVLKKGYGLPAQESQEPVSMSPMDQKMLSLARQNPNHPKAKAIFQKLGVSQ